MKLAGKSGEVVKKYKMRKMWPNETIDFLLKQIEWVYPVEKRKVIPSAINEKCSIEHDRGTPQRILCNFYQFI